MLARLKSRSDWSIISPISICHKHCNSWPQRPNSNSTSMKCFFFPPLLWFFSVSLPKKINLEDVSSFLGGDENPSNSRQLLPPDQALGRSEFCMQENQLHEETLGKALERAFPWWIWQQLRGKMAESNRIPLRCIGALVHWYVEQTIVLVEVKGCPVASHVHHVHMQSYGKSTCVVDGGGIDILYTIR